MTIFNMVITGLWLLFMAYWAFSARTAKKNADSAWKSVVVRIVIIAILLLTFRSRVFHQVFAASANAPPHPAVSILGVMICAAGIGIAVWARRHLGRNWGMPMSIKEKPELVSSGPYNRVRHPIYSGILLAMAGSALAAGVWWWFLLVVFGAYFIYGATTEERNMVREFPVEYPEYKRRTNILIPYVL